MAGIGFELKKLFRRKGIFASFRAYGYAGVICTGPMLLGVLLLLSVMFLCNLYNVSEHSRELIICMITYALLGSLTVTSFFSMAVTRFLADMLYEDRKTMILPSFWGSTGILLTLAASCMDSFCCLQGSDRCYSFSVLDCLVNWWSAGWQ